MCWSLLRNEFHLDQLRLRYPNPAHFAESPVSFYSINHSFVLPFLYYKLGMHGPFHCKITGILQ